MWSHAAPLLALGMCLAGTPDLSAEDSVAPVAVRSATSAICRPLFETTLGPASAGTGFLLGVENVGAEGGPIALLVTAHHLFGPDGGFPELVAWDSLPSFVTSVECSRFVDRGGAIEAASPWAVPGAHAHSEPGASRDIALFPAESDATALAVCTTASAVGDAVWLVAQVQGGEAPDVLLHRATVASVRADYVVFEYDNASLDLRATSGAPVVSSEGCVAGINIGANRKDERFFGLAQPAAVIRGSILDAMKDH